MDIINKLYDESNAKQLETEKSLLERAHRLHEQLVNEVTANKQDFYARNTIEKDLLVENAREAREHDIKYRASIGGPSIRQEKFHSAYWAYWYADKSILDRLSIGEYHKEIKRLTTRKVLTEEEKLKLRRLERNAYLNSKNVNRSSAPPANRPLGVTELWQEGLGYSLPNEKNYDSACNVVFKPAHSQPSKELERSSNLMSSGLPRAKGGAFGRDNKGGQYAACYTKGCDIVPLPSPFDTSALPSLQKGVAFPSAKRFPAPASGGNGGDSSVPTHPPATSSSTLPTGGRFTQERRFREEVGRGPRDVVPGPGAHDVKRLFDYTAVEKAKFKIRDFEQIYLKYKDSQEGMNAWTCQEITNLGVLGIGCVLEQHVVYGMCSDLKCIQRAMFEKTTLNASDVQRLGGYPLPAASDRIMSPTSPSSRASHFSPPSSPKSRTSHSPAPSSSQSLRGGASERDGSAGWAKGSSRAGLSSVGSSVRSTRAGPGDSRLLEAMAPLLPTPVFSMTPLYAAVIFGDIPTIRKLGAMGINPNEEQPDTGYSPLHIGVIKNQMKAVYHLLHNFHNSNIIEPGSKQWLNINAVDHKGNTALHYASRFNRKEICGMLCQEDDLDVYVVNNQGERALDVIGGHEVFTLIKFCQERIELSQQLKVLQQKKDKADAAAAVNSRRPSLNISRSRSSSCRASVNIVASSREAL
eukprot:gene25001-30201_t